MKEEMICIICPKGCHLSVHHEDEAFSVTGNACQRGAVYAKQEISAPVRMLTTTVEIHHALHLRCPVVSSQAVPKERLLEMVVALKDVVVEAPVLMHQVLVSDLLGLGIDILAARSFEKTT